MTGSNNGTSVTESIIIGSGAGGAEALINHPLWVLKIRLQSKEPFTLNPTILYPL